MKLLLTSNGLANEPIKQALEDLVGKPRKETKIAFIPNSALGAGEFKQESRSWFVNDLRRLDEYASFLDIVSMTDLRREEIIERLEYADVIFVSGGNAFYISYCMEKVGLFDELPRLLESRVYGGISAGSMVASASLCTASGALHNQKAFYDEEYDEIGPKGRSAGRSASLVNFLVRPHFGRVDYPNIRPEVLAGVAKEMRLPLYAIDDESAVMVKGDKVEVVSEGEWRLFKG